MAVEQATSRTAGVARRQANELILLSYKRKPPRVRRCRATAAVVSTLAQPSRGSRATQKQVLISINWHSASLSIREASDMVPERYDQELLVNVSLAS